MGVRRQSVKRANNVGAIIAAHNNRPFSVSTPRALPWSVRPDQAGVITVVDELDSIFGDHSREACVGQGARFLLALKVIDRVWPCPKISGMAGHLGDAGFQRSQQGGERVHTGGISVAPDPPRSPCVPRVLLYRIAGAEFLGVDQVASKLCRAVFLRTVFELRSWLCEGNQ
jgi:hypothetical protein